MKTTVEWLVKELINNDHLKSIVVREQITEEAEEMFKQQIMKAYYDGRNDESSSKARHNYDRNSEQYYNETFKNK